jgi:hypothetical protein
MVVLLSAIVVSVPVTAIAVDPIAAFTCSTVSSSPASSRSTSGRGIIVEIVDGMTARPVIVHPVANMQITATMSATAG